MTWEYREGPDEWKRLHDYGRKSLVETALGMMKVRLGGGMSSRGPIQQRSELLTKVVVHNIEQLIHLERVGR